jgi:hypothetical protein
MMLTQDEEITLNNEVKIRELGICVNVAFKMADTYKRKESKYHIRRKKLIFFIKSMMQRGVTWLSKLHKLVTGKLLTRMMFNNGTSAQRGFYQKYVWTNCS